MNPNEIWNCHFDVSLRRAQKVDLTLSNPKLALHKIFRARLKETEVNDTSYSWAHIKPLTVCNGHENLMSRKLERHILRSRTLDCVDYDDKNDGKFT